MAQILRIYKPDIPVLVRSYGTQRRQHNYYDVLRVQPGSTQKEIRQAYLKLSKEMHPDISGKKGHTEFVKINEAYSILSKEDTRRQYDTNFRYNDISSNSARNYSYHTVYTSRRQWEQQMAGYPGGPHSTDYPNNVRRLLLFCMLLIGVGTFIQTILVNYYVRFKRIRIMEKNSQLQREYDKIREEAQTRTTQEQLDRIYEMSQKYGADKYYK